MMQHDKRGKPRCVLWRSEVRVIEEQKWSITPKQSLRESTNVQKDEYLPESPQGPVVIPDNVQSRSVFTVVHHKCVQCEFELRHIACELQFPTLTQGFRDRHMIDECPQHILHYRSCPAARNITPQQVVSNETKTVFLALTFLSNLANIIPAEHLLAHK